MALSTFRQHCRDEGNVGGVTNRPDIKTVIGQNVRRLRGAATMDELAGHVRELGPRWTSGNVASAEAGRLSPTIPNVILLTQSLSSLLNRAVRPSELLEHDGQFLAGIEDVETSTELLAAWVSNGGDPLLAGQTQLEAIRRNIDEELQSLKDLNVAAVGDLRKSSRHPRSATESRIARNAGIDVRELRAWSEHLWSEPFETRRNRIAGEGASKQKRGRVTRELLSEILEAMEKNNGKG